LKASKVPAKQAAKVPAKEATKVPPKQATKVAPAAKAVKPVNSFQFGKKK